MAVLTDLTFQQLSDAFEGQGDPIYVAGDINGNIGVIISLTALSGEAVSDLGVTGVVKAVTRLLALCRKAQAAANEPLPIGEKLAAFPAAMSNNTLFNGQIEITEMVKSRVLIDSATKVIGSSDAA